VLSVIRSTLSDWHLGIFHAFFGLALMMGQGLLLADWFGAMGRTWGQRPLQDQQTGGAIAWGIGEFTGGR
jgi:putative copper resistance protein D